MAYASRTGTQKNLARLRRAGWGLFVVATGAWRTEGMRYAIDNGAWTAFAAGTAWDGMRFRELVARLGDGADFIVAPDVVSGGLASLRLSESWLPRLAHVARVLVPAQNGIGVEDMASMLGPRVGVFVGGDTAYKLATMAAWARACRERGAWCHVGRVNSAVRIHACAAAGVDSFDGSSASRYSVELPKLDNARRQTLLDLEVA
jgi:hypothetical protein